MSLKYVPPAKWRATALASALALLTSTMPMSAQTVPAAVVRSSTKTPIKHVIVIIGENRTFDHIFATYKPQSRRNDRQPALQRDRPRGRNAQARITPFACPISQRSINAADKYLLIRPGESRCTYPSTAPGSGRRIYHAAIPQCRPQKRRLKTA